MTLGVSTTLADWHSCGVPLMGSTMFLALSGSALDGWAASSSKYFNTRSFSTTNLLINAGLVNIPQLLLSVVYLAFNTLYISAAQAHEWNRMATTRKGLRVTSPQGEQRSTYFLQIPYRWGIPLMSASAALHWLISQTLFVVNLRVRRRDGVIDLSESTSACGFSALALLVLTCVGWSACILTGILSLLPVSEELPMAASCSAVYSASCHPFGEDRDAHLKLVQWGVTEVMHAGVKHCSFTSQPVTSPVDGEVYI